MSAHAILAPSSAHRWMTCKASLAAQLGRPDKSSKYADEGTAAHTLYAWCLERGSNARDYAGVVIPVKDNDGKVVSKWPVNQEMIQAVQTVLDKVRVYQLGDGRPGRLFVERRVDFSHVVGFADQTGTADTIIISHDYKELQIHDLKYGMGVKVDADDNEQMMTYALGALEEYELIADFQRIVMVIHQPRLKHLSEWSCSVSELLTFGDKLRDAAEIAMKLRSDQLDHGKLPAAKFFKPTEDNCRFCKASGFCKAQDNMVADCMDDFEDVDNAPKDRSQPMTLDDKMNLVGAVEDWCKAVRAAMAAHLLAGFKSKFWKIVRGKKGASEWVDEAKTEEILKSMRLSDAEMYSTSLITPTVAKKLLENQPKRLARITEDGVIKQAAGALSVAPMSDKRDAIEIKPIEDDFDDLEEFDLL